MSGIIVIKEGESVWNWSVQQEKGNDYEILIWFSEVLRNGS